MKQTIVKISVLILLMGSLFAAPVSALPMVSLKLAETTSISVDDVIEILVVADGDDIGLDLVSFGFNVDITDSGLDGYNFSYEGAAIASGFDDDSGFTDTAVSGSAFPGISEDEVLLTTLLFAVDSAGIETISVSGIYDGMSLGLYYERPDWNLTGYDIDASITIEVSGGSQPVPEPMTFLLLGVGLLAISGVKNRV